MRLTVFLVGAAFMALGLVVGTNVAVSATAPSGFAYQLREISCGSPFNPDTQFGPNWVASDWEAACSSAVSPMLNLAIVSMVLGAVFLVRLLYMLVGSKAPPPV